MSFLATWVDLETTILHELSQIYVKSYMWNLKIIQMDLLTKQKQTHKRRKQPYGSQKGGRGGINQEFVINRYTLLYIKQINNKDPLNSTENSTQYPVINHNRKELEKEYIHVCITEERRQPTLDR